MITTKYRESGVVAVMSTCKDTAASRSLLSDDSNISGEIRTLFWQLKLCLSSLDVSLVRGRKIIFYL